MAACEVKPVGTKKALVLCSGGVDSTTLLAMAVERFGAKNVFALSISYGQRHEKEMESAKAVAQYYGVEQRFLDLTQIFSESNCSLLAHSTQDIPEESYAEQLSGMDYFFLRRLLWHCRWAVRCCFMELITMIGQETLILIVRKNLLMP